MKKLKIEGITIDRQFWSWGNIRKGETVSLLEDIANLVIKRGHAKLVKEDLVIEEAKLEEEDELEVKARLKKEANLEEEANIEKDKKEDDKDKKNQSPKQIKKGSKK